MGFFSKLYDCAVLRWDVEKAIMIDELRQANKLKREEIKMMKELQIKDPKDQCLEDEEMWDEEMWEDNTYGS